MRIHGLTVCVDYADHLRVGLARWMMGLRSLHVVTSLSDRETRDLAEAHGARVAATDLFYADGAAFNKGRAMEWARGLMPWEDWILFFDADVVPEVRWAEKIERLAPKAGNLYSAWRHQCDDPSRVDDPGLPMIRGDGVGVGYFQLFHSSDPAVAGPPPLVETHWTHAGNYDNGFMHRWPDAKRIILPIRLAHQGSRDNWFGRGRVAEFNEMQAERRRRGGRWDHETIARSKIPAEERP